MPDVESRPLSRDCALGWHETPDMPHRCSGYSTTERIGGTMTDACGCDCHPESLAEREAKLEASRARVAALRARRTA